MKGLFAAFVAGFVLVVVAFVLWQVVAAAAVVTAFVIGAGLVGGVVAAALLLLGLTRLAQAVSRACFRAYDARHPVHVHEFVTVGDGGAGKCSARCECGETETS